MNKVLAIVFFCVISLLEISAQITTNSPYSRFGIGELQYNVFPEFNSLGGASTAFGLSNTVNPNNPATYTFFRANSFLLSTGGWNQTTKMESLMDNQTVNNNGFSHLVLGFPLTKKSGASFGLIPFSSTGYNIMTHDEQNNIDMYYYGDGGLSKVYFGAGYELFEGFSLGINASYLFGGLNRRKQVVYNEESFFNSRSNSKINVRGYYYELGVLYEKSLNKEDILLFGLKVNNNSSLSAKKTELVESFEFSGVIEIPKDTFLNSTEMGNLTLPKYISIGVSYNKAKKWLFIADYSMQDWSSYSMFDESDNLVNSMKICGGVEYTPQYNSINKYYKRIDYRLGASYGQSPLEFGNNQLKERSLTFGFGIPVKKSRTKYNFSCTLGQRGTTENNLIKEQFVRLGLSVAYDGIWFVKRKYD